jgi:hypothetical protein
MLVHSQVPEAKKPATCPPKSKRVDSIADTHLLSRFMQLPGERVVSASTAVACNMMQQTGLAGHIGMIDVQANDCLQAPLRLAGHVMCCAMLQRPFVPVRTRKQYPTSGLRMSTFVCPDGSKTRTVLRVSRSGMTLAASQYGARNKSHVSCASLRSFVELKRPATVLQERCSWRSNKRQ